MPALVITHAFADYQVGDHVTDPAQIAALKETGNPANFVAVNLAD